MSLDPEAGSTGPVDRDADRRPSSALNRSPQEPPNRGWLWFFIIVGVLTLAGVGLEIWFNYQQQVTLERVQRAWDLWKQNGPRDYVLDYTIDDRDGEHEAYTVNVSDGKAVSANRLEDGKRVPTDHYPYASVDAIFQQMEDWIKHDQEPSRPRVFMTATFDRGDGHLFRLIRSISSTRERREITVKLRPAS